MDSITTPVILSGGSGTRLWPVSLPDRPKQLRALVGNQTMIQATARRARLGQRTTPPVVVCSRRQVSAVVDQLEEVECPPGKVVVEPVARNTAPAVAAAALLLDPETVMTVLPADHLIRDTDRFRGAVEAAVSAAGQGAVVTFGVVPTRPETGFGYIEPGPDEGGVRPVLSFREKPEPAGARELVARGCLWNSGMFAFRAGVILEELRRFEPDLVAAVEKAVAAAEREEDGVAITLGDAFGDSPSISLDHAVMERTDRARVVPLDAGWTDVGSWQSLWETLADDGGNVTVGEVHLQDVGRSYIRSESRPVAVIGIDDVVVVETPDAVLVVDRERAQDVRSAAEWFERIRNARE